MNDSIHYGNREHDKDVDIVIKVYSSYVGFTVHAHFAIRHKHKVSNFSPLKQPGFIRAETYRVRSFSFPGSTPVCGVFFFQDERG